MNKLATFAVLTLVRLALFEIHYTALLITLKQDERYLFEDNNLPKVAIALSLRDSHSFLLNSLLTLPKQN